MRGEDLLINKLWAEHGATTNIIASMNWVYSPEGIPKRVASTIPILTIDGTSIWFTAKVVPNTKHRGISTMLMDNVSYTCSVMIAIHSKKEEKDGTIIDYKSIEVSMGEIPVCIGSTMDKALISDDSKLSIFESNNARGLDVNDKGGWFVIGSRGYVRLIETRLRFEKWLVCTTKKGEEYAKFTSSTSTGSTVIELYKAIGNSIHIHLSMFTKKTNTGSGIASGNTLNILLVYRIISGNYGKKPGKINISEIFKQIMDFVDPKYLARAQQYFYSTIIEYTKISNDFETMNEIHGVAYEPVGYKKNVFNELFPQIVGDRRESWEEVRDRKLVLLNLGVARYIEVLIGAREVDNKNDFTNISLVLPGTKFYKFFSKHWKKLVTTIEENITSGQHQGADYAGSVCSIIKSQTITNKFISAFKRKSWTLQVNKFPATEIYPQNSELGIAVVNKVIIPTDPNTKELILREVNSTKIGYIGLFDTPDSEVCGISLRKALGCWSSIERSPDPVRNLIYQKL
ncbi:unnamed protein product, partial [marine sediment metagenome]